MDLTGWRCCEAFFGRDIIQGREAEHDCRIYVKLRIHQHGLCGPEAPTLDHVNAAPPGIAAAITAGGQSRRFGQDKALYEVGGVPLLHRVAGSLHALAAPRLLIAAPGRYTLPGWQTIPDLRPGQGPLAGLETALTALLDFHPAGGWLAFAAVDLPHLTPEYWEVLRHRTGEGVQAVTGLDDTGRRQPLAALYHSSALPQVEAMLDVGVRRMGAVLERLTLAEVAWQQVAAVHPETYLNLNTLPERRS